MGSTVGVSCKCGVSKMFRIGGGMQTFRYLNYFPYLCKNCNCVVLANAKEEDPSCPKCNKKNLIRYDDPSLLGKKGDEIVAQSFDLELTNGTYKCGKCGNYTLNFYRGPFMWD